MTSLAQARTGTGKTLAFLIPVLQNIISHDPELETKNRSRRNSPDIRAIIISPTRELAEQIAVEAQKVVRHTGVIVQTAVGGSAKQAGLRRILYEGCHILVGTPGRLKDILSDRRSQIDAPNLSAFVLDEADRLLDQGFAPEIQEIQDLLPKRDRQTLLFSATVPEEVMQIVDQTMKPDYKFVRTVQPGEQQTHEKVPQKIVQVAGFENLMPALVELCKREIEQQSTDMPFKAIVYFNATAEVALAHAIFRNLSSPDASQFDAYRADRHPFYPTTFLEIHARLSQHDRTRTAESFKKAKTSILFSSDVTARGMDFPNVTHVIQMGLPPTRDTYIHRVGRTARGDKKGEGYLFITPIETRECQSRLYKLPLVPDDSFQTASVDMTKDAQLPSDVASILNQVVKATKPVGLKEKSAAYLASLGVYGWLPRKQALLDSMNNRSKYGWGLESPPAIKRMLATKLGLSKLVGINISTGFEDDGDYGRAMSSGYGRDRGMHSRGAFGRDRESSGGYDRGPRDFSRPYSRPDSRGPPGERFGRDGGKSRYGGDRGGSSYGGNRGGSSYGGDRGGSSYGGDRGGSSYGGDRGRSSGDRKGGTLSKLYGEN